MRPLTAGFVALAILAVACGGEELPEILVVRDFELVDQRGEGFGTAQLDGHVWVVSFVFTTCPDVCPLITNQLANLHRRVSDPEVRFVSISVDPETDTPERLADYGARYRADDRWFFLTGEPDEVRRVVTQVMRVPMGERNSAAGTIPHSEQFLLIDQRGTLRGAYDTDRAGAERLAADIGRLLAN